MQPRIPAPPTPPTPSTLPEPAAPSSAIPSPELVLEAAPKAMPESAAESAEAFSKTSPEVAARAAAVEGLSVATASSATSSPYFAAPSAPTARAGARSGKGFWGGSAAEIVFASLSAVLLLAMFIYSVAHVVTPASGPTTGGNPGTSSTSGTGSGNSSQATITAPAHKTYDAAAPAVPQGNVVNVKLVAQDTLISIAPGIAYHAWTFNGTVPGPVIHVRQGQTVNFTLVNNTGMAHSIDFHAAETPWNVNYQAVDAGKSFSFTWKANYPGVFMYHCGTPPVIQHLSNGMYGAIIVDPASGWSPAREYVLVQSEFYTLKMPDGSYSFDYNKATTVQPDYVTFNGYANQYKDAPLTAKLGQRVRLFVLNAGPSEFSAFHVIGAIFANAYGDGNPANHTVGNQTVTIPPGGGAVVELTIPAAGSYPFVTHAFANANAGALGVLQITK